MKKKQPNRTNINAARINPEKFDLITRKPHDSTQNTNKSKI